MFESEFELGSPISHEGVPRRHQKWYNDQLLITYGCLTLTGTRTCHVLDVDEKLLKKVQIWRSSSQFSLLLAVNFFYSLSKIPRKDLRRIDFGLFIEWPPRRLIRNSFDKHNGQKFLQIKTIQILPEFQR